MTTRRSLVIAGLITLAGAIYSAIMADQLPDIVPTHWGVNGQPDDFGSKWVTLLLMPGIGLAMMILMVGLPKLSPKKFEIETFRGTFNYIMLVLMCMFGVLHVFIMQATLHADFPIGRLLPAVLFLFFAVLGNVLGKVQRNFWMGIRTPWTLADVRVWDRTHRLAAKLWLFGGIVGLFVSLFGLPVLLTIAVLVVMAAWPVIQSYVIYQQLNRSGQEAPQ